MTVFVYVVDTNKQAGDAEQSQGLHYYGRCGDLVRGNRPLRRSL
jgi:hypothetical protein